MSHFLLHLTLSTSTSSLSPIFPTISPTHTRPSVHDACLPYDVPRQSGGSTHIPSLTVSEPKLLIETEAIEPEDLEPRKIELNRILGTDPCQEDMDEFGKVGAEMSYIESDYDSTESIADSDLEDGEQRKMQASPMKVYSREDCESSRKHTASGKTSEETEKFLEPTRKPKVIYTDKSLEFSKSCEDFILESLCVNAAPFRNKCDC